MLVVRIFHRVFHNKESIAFCNVLTRSAHWIFLFHVLSKNDWKNYLVSGFETSAFCVYCRRRMSISGIANVLGVSKSFLYSLVAAHPGEAPKSKEDLELWAAFVNRYRIEPTGGDRITHSRRDHPGISNSQTSRATPAIENRRACGFAGGQRAISQARAG